MVALGVGVLDLHALEALAVVPAAFGFLKLTAMQEVRQLLAVQLDVEWRFLAVNHVEIHTLDRRLITALVREADHRFDTGLDRNLCLEVDALAVVVGVAVVLVQGELGIDIRRHQDFQRGGLFGHQVVQGVAAHRDNRAAAHKQRDAGDVHGNLNRLAGGVLLAGVEVVEALVFVLGLGQVDRADGLALLDHVGDQV